MTSELKMLFFSGNSRQERLLLNGNIVVLPVAQVICAILMLENSFFEKVQNLPKKLEEIAADYFSEIGEVSFLEDEDICKQYLLRVKKCIDNLYGLDLNTGEELILQMLTYLPCFEAYSTNYDASMRLLPGKQYQSDLLKKMRRGNGIPTPEMLEYREENMVHAPYDTASTAWKIFIDILEDNTTYGLWSMTAKVIFDNSNNGLSYAEHLDKCILELKNLKRDLQYALIEEDKDTLSELCNRISWLKTIPIDSFDGDLFPVAEALSANNGQINGITSLTELVIAELNLMNKISRSIRRCKLCGGFFVPYQTQAIYCQTPNPDYDDQPCARIGSRIKFRENHAFLETPLGQKYMQNYKAYSIWVKRNTAFVRKKIRDVYGAERNNEEKEKRKEIRIGIETDINNRHNTWRSSAEQAKEMYLSHELSEEDYMNNIQLPKPNERSPLLAEFKRQYRAATENE